jgi:hypothetical protein
LEQDRSYCTVKLIDREWEKVPLVAKTNIVYPRRGVSPDVETDSSEFAVPPEVRVTFVGFRIAVGPLARIGETFAVTFTIPEKPLTLDSVRLAVAEEPCDRIMEVEFAAIVKSWGGGDAMSKNACAKCVSLPLYPVRFIVNVPVGVEDGTNTVSVELPVPVSRETEFGFAAAVMLVAVGGVAFRFTLPAKP